MKQNPLNTMPNNEKMWAKMKSILRKWRIRTKDKLISVIPQALNLVTPSDCQGWFTCPGY